MSDYVSGEKHREMMANRDSKGALPKPLLAGIVVIVLMGTSFYGGIAYQKSHQSKVTTSTASSGFSGRGGGLDGRGRFGGQRPTIGQVTAVSPSSITVQNSSSGSSTTLGITSNTQISDNGQTVTASDITVGETVLVAASSTDKTQASRILVNPNFGSAGGGNGQTDSSDSPPNDSNSSVTN